MFRVAGGFRVGNLKDLKLGCCNMVIYGFGLGFRVGFRVWVAIIWVRSTK